MTTKDTFLLYKNHRATIQMVDDAVAGRVFKAIFDKVNGIEPELKNGSAEVLVFTSIYSQIEHSINKYNQKCEANRANAKKRWNKEEVCERMQSHTFACEEKVRIPNDNDIDNDSYNDNLSLLEESEREILLSFARKRKADSPTAYVETLIANGSYLNILKDEKDRIQRKQQYEENRFYKPERVQEQTPEEQAECLRIIEDGKACLRNKRRNTA